MNVKVPGNILKKREKLGCSYCMDKPSCKMRVNRCPYKELLKYDSYEDFFRSEPETDIIEWFHDLFGVYIDSL